MALSGSIDLNYTAIDIVTEALAILGEIGEGTPTPSADATDQGLKSFGLLLKSWGTQPHLWLPADATVTPLLATASYTLTPRPLRVLSMRRRVSSVDTPLTALSRQEYNDLPNKSQTGTPL